MAQVSFTIPDAQLSRVLDAVAAHFNYDESKLDGETKAQFAKRMVITTVKGWVVDAEGVDGLTTARTTANSEVDIQE